MDPQKVRKLILKSPVRLKTGDVVPFGSIISKQQTELLDALEQYPRVTVLKARQIGISTVCRLQQVIYALCNPGVKCAIFSNKQRSAIELGQIDDLLFDRVLKSYIKRRTQNEVELINGSRILKFSGSSRNDRGYTLDHLHITEYAFIDHGTDILTSILASLSPRGRVVVESTPNYYGDAMHQLIQADAIWHTVFFPWFSFPGYVADPVDPLTPEEIELGLSPEQAGWARAKLAEYVGDKRRFRKEFPASVTEAYSLAGGTFLEDDTNLPVGMYQQEVRGEMTIHRLSSHQRNPQYKYVIGYDPAQGTGGDNAVACVYCRHTGEIVQVISSNRTTIADFTTYLIQISDQWNKAYIHLEINNHGHAADVVLRTNHFTRYSKHQTNAKSKVEVFDILRKALYSNAITAIDPATAGEIRTLVVNDKGLAPSAAAGSHDDRVMALCLAVSLDSKIPIGNPTISTDKYDYLYKKKQQTLRNR